MQYTIFLFVSHFDHRATHIQLAFKLVLFGCFDETFITLFSSFVGQNTNLNMFYTRIICWFLTDKNISKILVPIQNIKSSPEYKLVKYGYWRSIQLWLRYSWTLIKTWLEIDIKAASNFANNYHYNTICVPKRTEYNGGRNLKKTVIFKMIVYL